MSKHAKDGRPYIRPVEKVTLNDSNVRMRWIIAVVLILVAAGAIGLGVHYALQVEPGWDLVQANCDEPNYSGEIQLMYDFSADPGNATAINKTLSTLYSDIMEDAYRIFSKDADIEGVNNVFYLNQHINETVTVEDELYEAFALMKKHENRCIYLAPVYSQYFQIINAQSDVEAASYDPAKDAEAKRYITELMSYLNDSAMVDIVLLGDNRVILQVSEAYAAFAKKNDITDFLDFGWLRNAFVVDYAAQKLLENGFSDGYLTSCDGFNRSLSEDVQGLNFNLYHRQGTEIFLPAKMTYGKNTSLVFLRDFPLSEADQWNYYVYEGGTIASTMTDPKTGLNSPSMTNLLGYAEKTGCAEILLELLPVYFTDNASAKAQMELEEKGIHTVWCSEAQIHYTDADVRLTTLENQDGVTYTPVYRGE